MSDEGSSNKTTYCQDDIDDLAYSYVLSHGYEGALALLEELLANSSRDNVWPDDVVAAFCRRILEAIHDEAATIGRILDRMIPNLRNGACDCLAAVPCPGPNPIDRHIGNRLRQRRSELKLSTTALAMDLSVTPHALSLIEQGKMRLDAVKLERLVIRLDVEVSYFFQPHPHHDDATDTPQ